MNTKRWIVGIGIAVVILLSAPALFLANFSAMSSQMSHQSSLASSSTAGQVDEPIQSAKTMIFVSGEKRLAQSLEKQIAGQLQGKPQFGQLQHLPNLVDKADSPYLLIEIEPQAYFWTPVYARSTMKVTVSYASDGDVSFRLSQPTEFKHSGDQPDKQMSGIYTFSDVSWGLISNPGYQDYLAREMARPIAADLIGQNN